MRRIPLLVMVVVLGAACSGEPEVSDTTKPIPTLGSLGNEDPAPTTTTTVVATTTATTTSTTTSVPPPTTVDLPQAIEAWTVAGVDPGVFGETTITASVEINGTVVAVGCGREGAARTGFPAWRSDGDGSWSHAAGPSKVGSFPADCIKDVVSTPFGLFAHGLTLFRSTDGSDWAAVEFLNSEGYPVGYAQAMYTADERLTVLLQQGSQAESTIATLFTTTDGETWTEAPRSQAALFDSAGVSAVIAADRGGSVTVGRVRTNGGSVGVRRWFGLAAGDTARRRLP